jgi:hypothetical protein
MAEQLSKLRPDRDMQCYFERPSAVAALSGASASGFTVSGCWRQQSDWAVIEWNRDNVFEHPALRNLPDGDLSGITLSYQETRTNCIPLDSTLFATVDWPYLRVWLETSGVTPYYVRLSDYATAVGGYADATVSFELTGTVTAGDYIELSWLDQHFNYLLVYTDTPQTALTSLAAWINGHSGGAVSATASGTQIVLTYHNGPGSNGNRIGVYGTVHGARTEVWVPVAANFAGGVSPSTWQINLPFGSLRDRDGNPVTMTNVRKMRWTWAADLQSGNFARSEFAVAVTNWSVSGTKLQYSVAGTGSRRIEDDSAAVAYTGNWTEARGNYSGGSIRWTNTPGARVSCTYSANGDHWLYLGTRLVDSGGKVAVQVEGSTLVTPDLAKASEDVLVRLPIAALPGQVEHTVTITHTGAAGTLVYFDFLEIAFASATLPDFGRMEKTTLATDWDTDHSLAIAPERTAWLIQKLGFHGRANHYAGAMWFYELQRQGHNYASGTVTFSGQPEFALGKKTQVFLGGPTPIEHIHLIGDTAESIATCFALLINAGSTGVWARADGAVLTIVSRLMGSAGNALGLSANTNSTVFTATASGATLAGGIDGIWRTDTAAPVKLNRAARDWNGAFLRALKGYGIDVTASFSMELQHGDDTPQANLAQRYPNGDAVWLNTPALQTNFGPQSTAFWQAVYGEMADLMASAGVRPYVQFGEVQWWYFAAGSGMPFYDSYTTTSFQARYGKPMAAILSQNADPVGYADECVFLPEVIGEFTRAMMTFVRQTHADARFEVLYPPDVNDTALNRLVNFPHTHWTAASLDSLKTENFTYTGDRDLDKTLASIELPMQLGFGRSQSSHLVGIGEYTTPWSQEQRMATGEQLDSVVLFALDQFCRIGYRLPLERAARRSRYMGR